jgi:hypothetical protein
MTVPIRMGFMHRGLGRAEQVVKDRKGSRASEFGRFSPFRGRGFDGKVTGRGIWGRSAVHDT